MNVFRGLVFVGGVVVAVAASACARPAESLEDEAVPETVDMLDEQDEGTSYNGWTQTAQAWADYCAYDTPSMAHTLSRSYGDSTRGGGACHPAKRSRARSSSAASLAGARPSSATRRAYRAWRGALSWFA